MKQCKSCKQTKPFSDFGKDKRVKSGLTARCKFCNNQAIYEHKKKNPHLAQDLHLKSRYGITLETKQNMIAAQNNQCAICKDELINSKDTCVDHSHTTGKIREILCASCNKMLGYAKDNAKTLQNAIKYLTTHQQ
jgi:hypothetical protein